jgi:O-antigen/teichoic acid export membrane protein
MKLGDLLSSLDLRQRSEAFRQSARNASWSTLDYLILPLLLLVVLPFLVLKLGSDQFGIWMLVNALTGLTGVFQFGLSDATIKYVSSYRARKDWRSVQKVVRSTLSVYGLLGLLTAVLVYVAAPFLGHHMFRIEAAQQPLAISAIRVGGIGMSLRFVNSVFLAAVQGCERYDLSARVTIPMKALSILAVVSVAALGLGILAILWATVLLSVGGAVAMALVARRLISGMIIWPCLDRSAIREVFGFGLYSWLQSISSNLFAQADLFLVGALLGTTPVTYYSVCQRLAAQIHALPAAGSSFLFPLSSAAAERGNLHQMRTVYSRASSIVSAVAAATAVPMMLFSRSILTHWMGVDFAVHASSLLKVLAFSYALLAISIVPYNLLNGTGHVRANTLLGWLSVTLVVAATLLLVPLLGLAGVAWAKVANLGPLIALIAVVHRRVLLESRWFPVVREFIPILSLFGVAFLTVTAFGDPHPETWTRLIGLTAGTIVLVAGFAAAVQRIFHLADLASGYESS